MHSMPLHVVRTFIVRGGSMGNNSSVFQAERRCGLPMTFLSAVAERGDAAGCCIVSDAGR
eukprot:3446815-Pleurochrysis_carterae.AAC.2